MGEAKRRKKVLGDRYGQTPSVLIHGDSQLNKHCSKFSNAYFEKLRAVGKGLFSDHWRDNSKSVESQSSLNHDTDFQAMQSWLKSYLEPYRPQDVEKLVTTLLEPLFICLSADKEDDPE